MIHKQPGFSLLELVIGMAVSTILISITFTIYNQISKAAQSIQRVTSSDTKIMILQDRLQADLNGISPLWFTKEEYDKIKAAKKDAKDSQEAKQSQPEAQGINFFYSENKQGNDKLNYFTFPTVNAMQMYGTTNQRFVRVVYALEQDPKKENLLRLRRKEIDQISSEFDKAAIQQSGTFYDIATNITNCTVTYEFIDQPKHKKGNGAKEKSTHETIKPAKLASVPDWGIVKEQEKKDKYKPPLPEFIKLKITFAQEQTTEEKQYELNFVIPIDATNKINSFAQKHVKQTPKDAKAKAQDVKEAGKGAKQITIQNAKTNTRKPGAKHA